MVKHDRGQDGVRSKDGVINQSAGYPAGPGYGTVTPHDMQLGHAVPVRQEGHEAVPDQQGLGIALRPAVRGFACIEAKSRLWRWIPPFPTRVPRSDAKMTDRPSRENIGSSSLQESPVRRIRLSERRIQR